MKFLSHLHYLKRYWQRHRFVFGSYATPLKITNFLLSEWEAKKMSSTLHSHPWELFIDPVNSCPLECPLCVTGMRLHGRKPQMLSFDRYQLYINQLAPWLYKVKLFNYGEPFLNPAIFDMITYAHHKNIEVQINSNCNIWKDDYAERCIKSGLDTLVVSFDGISQEAYASYRKGGDVAKVKHAVASVAAAKKRLGVKKPAIVLQFLMQAHNEHEYSAVATYAQTVDALFFPQPLTFDITNSLQRDAWLPKDDDKTHYNRILACKKKPHPEKGCGFLWNNPVINVDGGISPCCHVSVKSTDFGSLEKENFTTIWNNESFKAARTIQRNRHLTTNPIVCNRCLNEKAFSDANYDLVNEYRSNLLS